MVGPSPRKGMSPSRSRCETTWDCFAAPPDARRQPLSQLLPRSRFDRSVLNPCRPPLPRANAPRHAPFRLATRPRHARPHWRGAAPPCPRRGDRAARRRPLRLRGMGHAHLRGHARLHAGTRRHFGRRVQGDVHLHRPRRRQPDLAAGGHGRPVPGAGEQRARPVGAAAQGVLHRADVPLRAPAEGALPAVPPDRHRGARLGRALGRCRGHRLRLAHPARARHRRRGRCWR